MNTLRELKASGGHYITQKEVNNPMERILAIELTLGSHDSPDNYKEVTIEEAMELRREMKEAELQAIEATKKREIN